MNSCGFFGGYELIYSCPECGDLKKQDVFSLDCSYFNKNFTSIADLIEYITINGMDPNYEITKNGKHTYQKAINLIQF